LQEIKRVRPCIARDVCRLQFGFRVGDLVRHHAVVEKIPQGARLDRKIDVLGDAACRSDDLQRIQFCGNHADHVTAGRQKRPAAIAGLNGGADLQESRVVEEATERTHDSRRDREIGGEQSMERKADRNDAIAGLDRSVLDLGDLLERAWHLKQREVVGLIRGDHTQGSGRLTGQIALNIADASIDDMLIGHNMPVCADEETGAGLVKHFVGLRRLSARRCRCGDHRLRPSNA
jgi:hypothetical protein